jgi:hypothetical protein
MLNASMATDPQPAAKPKSWLRSAFSESTVLASGSSSRLLTAIHSLVACIALLFVVHKDGKIPDAVTMTGLGGFATIHYAVNAARNVFQKAPDVPTG